MYTIFNQQHKTKILEDWNCAEEVHFKQILNNNMKMWIGENVRRFELGSRTGLPDINLFANLELISFFVSGLNWGFLIIFYQRSFAPSLNFIMAKVCA